MDTNRMRIFVTSWTGPNGEMKGSTVAAISWEHAQGQCDYRGLGETVDGELGEFIAFTPDGPITYEGTASDDKEKKENE